MRSNKLRMAAPLFFMLIVLIFASIPCFCVPELTKNEAANIINEMVTPGLPLTAEVKQITPQKGGVCAVLVDPPYREFPNVVIFKYDKAAKAWKRVKESLGFGIMFPSPYAKFVDSHVIGIGIDMVYEGKGELSINDDIKKMVDGFFDKDLDVAVYTNFLHIHKSGSAKYFMDKTNYKELSQKLLGDFGNADIEKKYEGTCMLYSLPVLTKIGLSYSKKKIFTIFGKTDNGQEWKATFSGVDENNNYLLNKTITASEI